MSRPGFSVTEIDVDKYSNWKLNQKTSYEVLYVDTSSPSFLYFLIADDNGEFVDIREDYCRLGEFDL